jgi:hypothetical protein
MIVPRLNRRSNLCSTASNGYSTRSTRIHGGPGPVAVRKKETPTPDHARVVVSTEDGVIHPDTGHRPGSDLPVAAHLTTLDQAAAHQRPCHQAPRRHRPVRHRPGPGVGHRPGLLPRRRHLGFLHDRLAARFDIGPGDTLTARLEAIGYDLADGRTAVLSHLHQDHIGGLPELERRPGHGSRARPLRDPAPTGVPVAAGRTACATTGEREAPPRSPLARTRRPRVAAAHRPGPRHRPRARGPRRARPWPAASRFCRCSSRMCQSRSLPVLNSRPQVTHFTGIGGSSRSTGRHAGCTPPRRRQSHKAAGSISSAPVARGLRR